jgi:hypothetical protein
MKRDQPRTFVTFPLRKLFPIIQPDFDIYLELFDPSGLYLYESEDCKTVLISQCLESVSNVGFSQTSIQVHQAENFVDVKLERNMGYRGNFECIYKLVEIDGNSID